MRLERLVGDVLDLAKLDARRFALLREEVDMRALCERAYATFAEEAKARGIEYDLELDEGAVLVTDGDRVLQIVTNLLANALHWTPEGGRVDLGLSAQNGEVAVAVADTGPGIGPELRGADLPAVLVAATAAARGSAWRSRASSHWRSAAGSSCTASPATAAASCSCYRRGLLSRLLDARRGGRRRRRRASVPPRASPAAPRRSASRRR